MFRTHRLLTRPATLLNSLPLTVLFPHPQTSNLELLTRGTCFFVRWIDSPSSPPPSTSNRNNANEKERISLISSSHVITPQNYPLYYASEYTSWLQYVDISTLVYKIGSGSTGALNFFLNPGPDGSSVTSKDGENEKFEVRHHKDKNVDLGSIDFDVELFNLVVKGDQGGGGYLVNRDDGSNGEEDGVTGVRIFDVSTSHSQNDHADDEEEVKVKVNSHVNDNNLQITVDGYAIDDSPESDHPESQDDTRILKSLSTTGSIISGQSPKSARIYAKTELVLPVGMCGAPILNLKTKSLLGVIEGIVPIASTQAPEVLLGAAAYASLSSLRRLGGEQWKGGLRQ